MNGWVRRQATFLVRSTSIDAASGTEVESWAPLITGSPATGERFWVMTRDVKPGREVVRSGLQIATNQTELTMRWRSDITSAMKIVLHGDSDVEYQIIAGPVEVGGRKRDLLMTLERSSS